LQTLAAINPLLLSPSKRFPNRRNRIDELNRRQEVKRLTADLSRNRAMKEFSFRYERRFHPKKWSLIAKLVHLIEKNPELRFCPSLDRCFKRVLFRSSRCSTRNHPIQRVGKEELLHVITQNYSGKQSIQQTQSQSQSQGKGKGKEKGTKQTDAELQTYTRGPHRGRTKRQVVVQEILKIVSDLYVYFDVYKIDENEQTRSGLVDHTMLETEPGSATDVSTSYIDPRELLCAIRVVSHPGLEAGEPHLRYWFDLYAHTWLVLNDDEHINLQDGTITNQRYNSSSTNNSSGRRTAGGGSSLLPSTWSTKWENETMRPTDAQLKYNSVGVRSGTPISQKLSASAASLCLSGFASVSTKTESVPWRELQMACVVTATTDFEYELLSGLATRAFLGPNTEDMQQAVKLEHLLESSSDDEEDDSSKRHLRDNNRAQRAMLQQRRKQRGKRKDREGFGTLETLTPKGENEHRNITTRGSTTSKLSTTSNLSTSSQNTFYGSAIDGIDNIDAIDATGTETTGSTSSSMEYDPFITTVTTLTTAAEMDSLASLTDLSHLESTAAADPDRGTITRAKFELGLHTLAGRRLVAEIQRQLWKRQPAEQRSNVRHQRCEQTREEVLRLEKLVFQPGVTNLFVKYKPKQKFNMWRRAVSMRRSMEVAVHYRTKRDQALGVYVLVEHVKARVRKRRLDWLADRHSSMSRIRFMMEEWKEFTSNEIQEREIFMVQAIKMWNRTVLRLRLYKWRLTVMSIMEERAEAIAKAVFLCNATLMRKVCQEWHVAAHDLREENIATANQEWFSAMMSKADEERETRDMGEEDEYCRAFYKEETDLREKKELEEYWERKRYVFISLYNWRLNVMVLCFYTCVIPSFDI